MYDSPQVEREHLLRLHERETVLSCSKARYYNPGIGRFVSEDDLGRPTSRIVGFWHSYSYVDNDPINWTDPSGLIKHSPKGVKKIECRSWIDRLECTLECALIDKAFDRCWEVWIKKDVIEDGKPKKRWWKRDELECWCKDNTCQGNECVILDAMESLFDTGVDLGLFWGIPCGSRGAAPAPARR